uniref:Uncharacterized protein n=1 Tax=Avena sativa TaxID=4498 RepID=A0ACD5TT22_AVESA
MEATVLSVGKSVVSGALSYARSALAEEVALQLRVQRDQAFITDELEMMQAFLMAAHDERGDNHRTVKVWVKQVRDVAYDVEDCLQDFAVSLERTSWWRVARTVLTRRHVARQMKELRAKVEDVSQRNVRYQLINSTAGSRPITGGSSAADATMFGINEEGSMTRQQDRASVDLVKLINRKGDDLRVISVWGAGGAVGQTSAIRAAYESPNVKLNFPCRAWARVIHPFDPNEFLQSLVKQFGTAVGVDLLLQKKKTGQDLADEYKGYVDEKSYLVVLTGLSTIEEWDDIKACFPNSKRGSRIILSTSQIEVASLCAGPESIVSELKQLSSRQNIYAFHEKDSPDGTDSAKLGPSRSGVTATTSEILQDHPMDADRRSIAGSNSLTRIRTMKAALEESHLVGRDNIKSDIIKLMLNQASPTFQVISVWGMGGLGKTTLIKDIYQSQELSGTFEKRACVTVMRPFILEKLLGSIVMQLDAEPSEKDVAGLLGSTKRALPLMNLAELTEELARHLDTKRCLIVLDDISCNVEWDLITRRLPKMENASRIIVTTREEIVARHCSANQQNIYQLEVLQDEHAHMLFTKKIFKETVYLEEQYPELVEQANMILKKCDGLPLAIVTIGGFLANQPKTGLGASLDCRGILKGGAWESIHSRKGIDSCQVHDLIREIGISKSTEGNLVFRLEKDCSLNSQGKIRHLSISSNWEGDQVEFESIVDMSRIRSLTVFGKWRPFFISDKMRLLRVLDLEGTSGLVDHHLECIGKLLHIRYLSLRGCKGIYHLPDSLGNLRQLQTLDVTGTCIIGLPQTIVKLSKLQNICAGAIEDNDDDNLEIETCQNNLPNVMRNRLCVMTCSSMAFCVACCAPQFLKEKMDMDVDVNRRDVCTMCCYNILPLLATRQSPRGIAVPRGIRRLKALQKLGIVNIRWAKAVLRDIKELNQLRKLGVIGVNKRNSRDLFSAVADLSCLESLLVQSLGYPGLCGCLDGVSSPPANLQSLKLYGNIVKLAKWIQGLTNLVKLRLRSSRIVEHDAAIQLLGKIPNLATLRLWKESFVGNEVGFTFRQGAFPNLVVLELDRLGNLQSVKFGEGATPKLELLQFRDWTSEASTGLFIGLPNLPSLKEFMLMEFHNGYKDDFVEELRAELAKNLNRPALKRY